MSQVWKMTRNEDGVVVPPLPPHTHTRTNTHTSSILFTVIAAVIISYNLWMLNCTYCILYYIILYYIILYYIILYYIILYYIILYYIILYYIILYYIILYYIILYYIIQKRRFFFKKFQMYSRRPSLSVDLLQFSWRSLPVQYCTWVQGATNTRQY